MEGVGVRLRLGRKQSEGAEGGNCAGWWGRRYGGKLELIFVLLIWGTNWEGVNVAMGMSVIVMATLPTASDEWYW